MTVRARKNVGVIGLGIIGQRVVENLREHGFHVFVWNRTPRPVPNFVGSPIEVVELCERIQIFVSDDEALLQVVQRVSRKLSANHIIMAHCTVAPDTMRAAAEIVGTRGARFLDAPFTGSKTAAERGQLVYYVGGDETALQQVRPILEASSKEIIAIGQVGDATTIKVATNMVTASTVQGAAEALALVAKAGLPAEKFMQAMKSNGSYSGTLEMKLPMMTEANYEAHFSVKHMLKDVVIATRLARVFGIETGATDTSRRALLEQMKEGSGDDDYSALFRQYFPGGLPEKRDERVLNGEEVQPRFAGLDEEAKVRPNQINGPAETNPAVTLEQMAGERSIMQRSSEQTVENPAVLAEEKAKAVALEMSEPLESHSEPTVETVTPETLKEVNRTEASPEATIPGDVAQEVNMSPATGPTGEDKFGLSKAAPQLLLLEAPARPAISSKATAQTESSTTAEEAKRTEESADAVVPSAVGERSATSTPIENESKDDSVAPITDEQPAASEVPASLVSRAESSGNISSSAPGEVGKREEPVGMWGNFWRRRTED